jgi:hypothetical protein
MCTVWTCSEIENKKPANRNAMSDFTKNPYFINGSTVTCLCYSGFTVNTIYIHVDSNYTLIEAGF